MKKTNYKERIEKLKENLNFRVLLDNIIFNMSSKDSKEMVNEVSGILKNFNIQHDIIESAFNSTPHFFIETRNYIIDPTIRYLIENNKKYKSDYIFDVDEYYEDIIQNETKRHI
jgi:hypothetical protein